MNENEEPINETLSLVFKDPFYWAVLLALMDGPRSGLTVLEIKKRLADYGVVRSLDQAWAFIECELEKLKNDSLAENQINEENKFKLTCAGRKAAKLAKELIDKLIYSKQAKAENAG